MKYIRKPRLSPIEQRKQQLAKQIEELHQRCPCGNAAVHLASLLTLTVRKETIVQEAFVRYPCQSRARVHLLGDTQNVPIQSQLNMLR